MKDLSTQFRGARRCSVPLIAVRTPDPAATQREIIESLNGDSQKAPLFEWDLLRGLRGVNEAGRREQNKLFGDKKPEMVSGRPTDALMIMARIAQDAIIFMANAHRFWNDPGVAQGIWNLRDPFKEQGIMLVMTTTMGATLPIELVSDVMVIDEDLPKPDRLREILRKTYEAIELPQPDKKTIDRAVDATTGLAAFPAEQEIAVCLTKKNGLDIDSLWERKRKIIEQNRGLQVWRGGERYDQIGGCENVKQFNRQVINGRQPFGLVMFIDEIDKALAGFGTDSSGVKTDMVGMLLTWMQDNEVDGELYLGPPGSGKTNVAKATGNEAGVPTIQFDVSGMQSSLVGTSGEFLRNGLKVGEAMSGDKPVLVIATCNSMSNIPSALLRRFTLGKFFFDLPTADERNIIWDIYLRKYELKKQDFPDDDGWTGAEIKECCRKAWRLNISLKDSADYIIPVARSAAEEIKELRQQASNRLISAADPGYYKYEEQAASSRPVRKMRDTTIVNLSPDNVGSA